MERLGDFWSGMRDTIEAFLLIIDSAIELEVDYWTSIEFQLPEYLWNLIECFNVTLCAMDLPLLNFRQKPLVNNPNRVRHLSLSLFLHTRPT
jgi:hypothetical protein